MLIDKMMPILEQLSDLLVTRIVLRAVVVVVQNCIPLEPMPSPTLDVGRFQLRHSKRHGIVFPRQGQVHRLLLCSAAISDL